MATDNDPQRRRLRLPRKQREKLIVDEAVRFFAEVGFEGQTRALATRLGVTQPLLYRYFPDKDALIERVYEEVFLAGWDPAWATLLADRSRPLADRMIGFYRGYTQANFSYERMRLFLFAGLKDEVIARRYLAFTRENLFIPVAREIRAMAGMPTDEPTREAEIDYVAGLHGAIGFVGLRHWVFQAPVDNIDAIVEGLITTFVKGAASAFRGFEAERAKETACQSGATRP